MAVNDDELLFMSQGYMGLGRPQMFFLALSQVLHAVEEFILFIRGRERCVFQRGKREA